MVCPSCNKEADSTTACSCGARWVGQPSTEPIYTVPRLSYGIAAAALIGLIFAIQAVLTIRSLYLSNLQWHWELYLTTSYLAKFLFPAIVLACFVSWRGLRFSIRRPSEYGGTCLSRICLVSSLLLCFIDGGAILARLPDMLEGRRLKQQAYTEAMRYQLNSAIARFRQQYGTYPERLIDLQEMDPSIRPVLDYWEHALVYSPRSTEVASRVSPVTIQSYQLTSRGPDGILGTGDDIVMRDGLIVPAGSNGREQDPAAAPPGEKKPAGRTKK